MYYDDDDYYGQLDDYDFPEPDYDFSEPVHYEPTDMEHYRDDDYYYRNDFDDKYSFGSERYIVPPTPPRKFEQGDAAGVLLIAAFVALFVLMQIWMLSDTPWDWGWLVALIVFAALLVPAIILGVTSPRTGNVENRPPRDTYGNIGGGGCG